jgi:hypothetical protein
VTLKKELISHRESGLGKLAVQALSKVLNAEHLDAEPLAKLQLSQRATDERGAR